VINLREVCRRSEPPIPLTISHLHGCTMETSSYEFMGDDIAKCSEDELTLHRRAGVGFVFQNFNLIDDLNVADNVEVGLIYRKVSAAKRRQRVDAALEQVGLAHRKKQP
jgi:putative ABC transport system ATP-binding protein